MLNKKNNIIVIGAVFTVISFLLSFTIFVPMYTVMPAAFVEQLISGLFTNSTAPIGALVNIVLISALLITTILVVFNRIKTLAIQKRTLSTIETIGYMLIFGFLVHSLGFYLFWGIVQGFQLDALYIMSAVYSFPFSSFFFIFVGFLMNKYQNKCLNNQNE